MSSEDNHKKDQAVSLSPTLITRYAHKSSRLIYSIERNIYIVIGVVVALAAISIIDTLEIIGITDFIRENLDDPVIAILSLISLAALVPILRLSFQSKKTLEEWADMFEHNSIRNSISMALASLTREDVVFAIAETVQEIGEPLLEYAEKGKPSEFFDREINAIKYDILIDSETVNQEKGAHLKRLISQYGAIIVKIVDGRIGKEEVLTFSKSITNYAKQRRIKDAVGLAIMIGTEVSPDAYAQHVKDLLLVEKP